MTITPLLEPAAEPDGRPRRPRPPNPRLPAVVGGCAVVVASYVVADAFVLLRPGTSPADHLVSGVVPVVLLAAMAWVVPRVRSGVAASVCGTVGLATVTVVRARRGVRSSRVGSPLLRCSGPLPPWPVRCSCSSPR
jgi:hypothetical protein